MKILHLSNTPLSNAPDNLVRCQNEAGHEAKLFLNKKQNTNKVFVGGMIWRDLPEAILERAFVEAEVLHFHNYCWELEIFKVHPHLLEIAKKKPALIQYHSPRNSTENFEESIADKSLKHAVIAQYHVRQYPECEFIVPNVIPLFEKRYQPIPSKWNDPMPLVSFAPSNITLKGWDNKGYDIVDPILRRLESGGLIGREVLINLPYEECMSKKRWAHIGIDEVMTGSYHLSALEYMAMGAVTVVKIDDLTFSAIEKVIGKEGTFKMPIQGAAANTLENTLIFLAGRGMSYLHEQGDLSRQWMETYWNPKTHVKRFEEIYKSL